MAASSLKLSNNGLSTLAAGITSSDTSITLATGDGSKFPALSAGEWFMATLVKSTGTFEIVKVTARFGDVLTVTRAQEGTTASAFSAGDRIEHRLTAGTVMGEFARIDSAIAANSGGATGGGTDAIFNLNNAAITTDYTIPAGKNAGSFGPITHAAGVITINSGSVWTVS